MLRVDPLGRVHYDGESDDSDPGSDRDEPEVISPSKEKVISETGSDAPAVNEISASFTPATYLRPKVLGEASKVRFSPPSLAHSACAGFFSEGLVVLFGGNVSTDVSNSGVSKATNETWVYHTAEKKWQGFNSPADHVISDEIKTRRLAQGLAGDVFPPPRCGHCVAAIGDVKEADPVSFVTPDGTVVGVPTPQAPTAATLNNPSAQNVSSYSPSVLMFGGANLQQGTYYNDLWLFDVQGRAWVQLNPLGEKPCPRWQCVSGSVENRFFVFGGEGMDFEVLNDLHMYDHAKKMWVPLRTVEPVPKPRMMHAATVVGDKMVVVGGIGKSDQPLDDVWILEMRTLLWRRVMTERSKQSPFRLECHVSTHSSSITSLSTASSNTSVAGYSKPKTHSIEGHVVIGFDDSIVVFGGKVGKLFNRYVWMLNLQSGQWTIVGEVSAQENTTGPQARWQHCACAMKEYNVTHTMNLALKLDHMRDQRVHLSEESETNAYISALATRLARQINFEGLLITHRNKPIMVRTVSAYIFGGTGFPRQFSDMWKLELLDSNGNPMYDYLMTGRLRGHSSLSNTSKLPLLQGVPQAAVVADTEQLATQFFFADDANHGENNGNSLTHASIRKNESVHRHSRSNVRK
jgi:hypothetical protein